jgi:WD40 repeat protein
LRPVLNYILLFYKEGSVTPGHSSRVYCAKFDKEYPNLVLTGGWDYRVILWDLREGKPVNSIFGPLICGDGIDICEEVIIL